jgi:hypothetical protein
METLFSAPRPPAEAAREEILDPSRPKFTQFLPGLLAHKDQILFSDELIISSVQRSWKVRSV